MKLSGFSVLALAAVLAGCAAPAEDAASHMTQSIVSGPLTASQPEEPSSSSAPEEEGDYYYWKAMKEALEIELDTLEARYRVGEMPEEEFRREKEELELEIKKAKAQKKFAELRQEKEEIERSLEGARSRAEYDPKLEEEIEWEQEELEEYYRREKIARDEFISRWAELEKQDNELEELEEDDDDDDD